MRLEKTSQSFFQPFSRQIKPVCLLYLQRFVNTLNKPLNKVNRITN